MVHWSGGNTMVHWYWRLNEFYIHIPWCLLGIWIDNSWWKKQTNKQNKNANSMVLLRTAYLQNLLLIIILFLKFLHNIIFHYCSNQHIRMTNKGSCYTEDYNPCRYRDSNPGSLGYKSDSQTILQIFWWNKCSLKSVLIHKQYVLKDSIVIADL